MGYWEDIQRLAAQKQRGKAAGYQTKYTASPKSLAVPRTSTYTTTSQVPAGSTAARQFGVAQQAAGRAANAPVDTSAFGAFTRVMNYPNTAAPTPQSPTRYPGGSGSGGGGGGGGGGGAAGISQSAAEMIARLLGQRPQAGTFQPLDLPDYQGMPLTPFDTSIYDLLSQRINTAGEADRAAAGSAYDQLTNTLNSTYQNAYAGVNPTATPAIQGAMQRLVGGGGAAAQGLAATNAANQNSDAAFSNLLAILGMNEDAAQRSRLAQAAMGRTTANQAIDADVRGLQTGVDVSKLQGQRDWQQRADERAYQDSQLAQQWARDEALQNWQGQTQMDQYNNQLLNDWQSGRVSPLMELITMMSQSGLDPASLSALIGV